MNIGPIFFLKPHVLNWILLLPFIYLLYLLMEKRRKAALEKFVSSQLWKRVIPELDWTILRRKFLFWCIAVFWILVALARPQYGEKEDIVPTNGFDLILAIDVSNSMLAEDVVPSRLKKTKRFVKKLLERLAGDRVGLVAFAGTSQLLVPLTTDLDYVNQWVENLATDSVGAQGTDLGGAIEASARALDRGAEQNDPNSPVSKASRIVVIISDGEDHEAQIENALKKVSQETLNVYTFGVGTEQGGPIPVRDTDGRNLGYKRDRSGNTVTTKLSSSGLVKLAEAGSGKYWTMSPGEGELDSFISEVDSLTRTGSTERKVVLREDRFQIPLAFAILFLILELLTRSRLSVENKNLSTAELGSFSTKKVGLLIFLFILTSDISQASTKSFEAYEHNKKAIESAQKGKIDESKRKFADALTADPDSPEIVHNQGVLQLQQKKLKEAIELFESSSKQAAASEQYDLQAMSLYDLGVAKTLSKDRDGAVDAYIRALESLRKAPNAKLEAMTRKNLELLFKKQSNQGKGDPNEENQDQKDQKDQKDKSDQSKSDQNKDQDNEGKGDKDSENKSGNESGSSEADQGKDDPKKKDQEGGEKERNQNVQQNGKQRNFKSEKLSKEDAERVLQGLAQAEEKLQDRMKRQKGRPQGLEKDW